MNKKKRSIFYLILTVLVTALVGVVQITGMPLWTPWEVVPMIGEIELGLDLQGGMRVVYQADFTGLEVEDEAASLQGAMDVLRTRLDTAGYTEATITKQGNDQIVVEVPGVGDANELSDVLMAPAVLEFRDPDGKIVLLTGEDVESAKALYSPDAGYFVSLDFNEEGKKKFADATSKYVGKTINIYLDEECISSPNVKETIAGGEAMITGDFTLEQVQNLANLIQSGALPIPLNEIAIKNVGATLGAGSLEKTLIAGLIAIAIIFLFMLLVYRLPGLMADLALAIYLVLMVWALYAFDVTLTLSGIAGIILSIGMAVDANVVIFERIKEELLLGRSLKNSIEKGFNNAIVAVLDANITTMIAVIVLAIFGTGTVQGFAVTLGIGIVLSIVTEVIIVRTFLRWVCNMGAKNPKLYGVKLEEVKNA
ncbi:MAG: protein translocase subunit SecD [Clostridiales bacterium]|nr:protein translocase subunit SecD [Clostridiales bacterium]